MEERNREGKKEETQVYLLERKIKNCCQSPRLEMSKWKGGKKKGKK